MFYAMISGIKQRTLRKGDIVGCLNPHDHKQLLCKRLAGMVIFHIVFIILKKHTEKIMFGTIIIIPLRGFLIRVRWNFFWISFPLGVISSIALEQLCNISERHQFRTVKYDDRARSGLVDYDF